MIGASSPLFLWRPLPFWLCDFLYQQYLGFSCFLCSLENPSPHFSDLVPHISWASILVLSFPVLPPDVVVTGPVIPSAKSGIIRVRLLSPSYLWHQLFLWAHLCSLFCPVLSNSVDCGLLHMSLPCSSFCAFFLSLFSISDPCFLSSSELLNTDVFRQHLFLAVHCRQHTAPQGIPSMQCFP